MPSDAGKAEEILVYRVVVPESTSILSTNVQRNAERTERLTRNTMGMTRGDDIGPRLMNGAVNLESSSIDGMHISALTNLALFIHENEIGYFHVLEALEEWIDPEVARQNGVADRDVTCTGLVAVTVFT